MVAAGKVGGNKGQDRGDKDMSVKRRRGGGRHTQTSVFGVQRIHTWSLANADCGLGGGTAEPGRAPP
jgi:hypothetical protein